MSEAVSGKDGDVVKDGLQICEVVRWSFTATAAILRWLDNSAAAGGFFQRASGGRDGEGNVEGKYDPGRPPYGDLPGQLREGASARLYLYLTPEHYLEVPCVFGKFQFNVDIDSGDLVSWAADFGTNGAWFAHLAELSSSSTTASVSGESSSSTTNSSSSSSDSSSSTNSSSSSSSESSQSSSSSSWSSESTSSSSSQSSSSTTNSSSSSSQSSSSASSSTSSTRSSSSSTTNSSSSSVNSSSSSSSSSTTNSSSSSSSSSSTTNSSSSS